ncbi:hypothetical protein [Burkholderia alba]|uniref:hypothetical protein n=1 Tax=Burkholderia alba TaxID=2683677 RepID=UPI002B052711|nr:hypothetical protein [Burkholderia alba]
MKINPSKIGNFIYAFVGGVIFSCSVSSVNARPISMEYSDIFLNYESDYLKNFSDINQEYLKTLYDFDQGEFLHFAPYKDNCGRYSHYKDVHGMGVVKCDYYF